MPQFVRVTSSARDCRRLDGYQVAHHPEPLAIDVSEPVRNFRKRKSRPVFRPTPLPFRARIRRYPAIAEISSPRATPDRSCATVLWLFQAVWPPIADLGSNMNLARRSLPLGPASLTQRIRISNHHFSEINNVSAFQYTVSEIQNRVSRATPTVSAKLTTFLQNKRTFPRFKTPFLQFCTSCAALKTPFLHF